MRIIPVLDLQQGVVVRGIAGRRSEYRPIHSHLTSSATPRDVAHALVALHPFPSAYLADLDAIAGSPPNAQAYGEIQLAIPELWIDAGIGKLEALAQFTRACQDCLSPPRLVIGMETLHSQYDLASLVQQSRSHNLIFSLDLRGGEPLTQIVEWKNELPFSIAAAAIEHGLRSVIVLDLADVGENAGTRTHPLLAELHQAFPQLELIAGGGVRNIDDLETLAQLGCSAVLIASALHDGRIDAATIARFSSS